MLFLISWLSYDSLNIELPDGYLLFYYEGYSTAEIASILGMLNVLTAIMELGAVFFLIQSMISVVKEGNANWYLPLALGLNCIGLFLNAIQRKRQKDSV